MFWNENVISATIVYITIRLIFREQTLIKLNRSSKLFQSQIKLKSHERQQITDNFQRWSHFDCKEIDLASVFTRREQFFLFIWQNAERSKTNSPNGKLFEKFNTDELSQVLVKLVKTEDILTRFCYSRTVFFCICFTFEMKRIY